MKKLALFLCLCFSTVVFADSTITIPVPKNGVLGPKGDTLVMTTVGYGIPGVSYNVTCHFNAPENILIKLVYSYMYMPTIVVNGKNSGHPGYVTFPQGDNKIEFNGVHTGTHMIDENFANFGFTNMDNTLSAKVSDCTATPNLQ